MKATLLDRRRFNVLDKRGCWIVIEMELFVIPSKSELKFPDAYRLGWIAFEQDNPQRRVLFDAHAPKGLHYHIDGDTIGTPFDANSVLVAKSAFLHRVREHFGIDLKELE